MNSNPNYPSEWGTVVPDRLGACPLIAGTYFNKGELAIETGMGCANDAISEDHNCSLRLSANLNSNMTAPAIRLTQPDGDTLEMIEVLEDQRVANKLVLRRGKDFQCDKESLYWSDTQSSLGGAGMTAVGILFLTGGAERQSRAFFRTVDGDLVMTVRVRKALYHIIFGISGSTTGYVRWHSVTPKAPVNKGGP